MRHRRGPAGLPRRRRSGPLALRRLGLARAGRDRVHRRAGERQPRPTRPAIAASSSRRGPDGELVGFGAEHDDFRVHSLARRVHPVSLLAALRRPGRRAAVRAGRRRQRPRLRPRRLPAHRGPRRAAARDHRRLAARRRGGPRRARARPSAPPTSAAASAGSTSRRTARRCVTDVRNCAVADGFATALQSVPRATERVGGRADRRRRPSSPGPEHGRRLRRGPGARRRPQPRLRAAPGLGRQRLPGLGGRRRLGAQRRLRRRRRAESLVALRPARRSFAAGVAGAGAGATVCALTRVLADGQPIVVGATATTGADGSYAIELPPGPSREVFVHYVVGDEVIARHGLVAALERAAHARRCSPNHGVRNRDRLYFAGTLPGPCLLRPSGQGPGAAGQAPLAGLPHRPRRRRLRVHRPLQAARHRRRGRYRFRALVPQAAGYPYERGHSRDGQGQGASGRR